MLGFDIKYVVAFMTTPCVSLINDLSEANMMDSYISELSIKNAIDLATGIVDPSKFLFGSISTIDEYGNRGTISRVDDVFGRITSGKLYSIKCLSKLHIILPLLISAPNSLIKVVT